MKFVFLFLALFSNLSTVESVVNYKILKLDNCTSSDESVFGISTCEVTLSRINITVEIKRPLTKFYVNKSIKLLSSFINFSQVLNFFDCRRFSSHSSSSKTMNSAKFSKLRGLSGVRWCLAKRTQTGLCEVLWKPWRKSALACFRSVPTVDTTNLLILHWTKKRCRFTQQEYFASIL